MARGNPGGDLGFPPRSLGGATSIGVLGCMRPPGHRLDKPVLETIDQLDNHCQHLWQACLLTQGEMWEKLSFWAASHFGWKAVYKRSEAPLGCSGAQDTHCTRFMAREVSLSSWSFWASGVLFGTETPCFFRGHPEPSRTHWGNGQGQWHPHSWIGSVLIWRLVAPLQL